MSADRFFVKRFDAGDGKLGTWSVLERNGCKDTDHRIVCDCLLFGDDGVLDEQTNRDAEMICKSLNLFWEQSK